jgi:hypothetical protein
MIMLNPVGKTEFPNWAMPYEPTWEGDQWIVVFPEKRDAKRGLLVMQMNMGAPRLACAPYPDSSTAWYVGVL